jgi:hypothetical protein
MRMSTYLLAAAFVVSGALAAGAQPAGAVLSPLETSVACAPPPTLDGEPGGALHIIGTQDAMARTVFGSRDLIVVDGGEKAGIRLGQQFFVRRANRFGMYGVGHGRGAKTLGWIHVVAVNESTAIAQVDHLCDALIRMDYLEPFVAPAVPAGLEGGDATGDPDFGALGQIIAGDGERTALGSGDFALIDRGSEQGVTPGQHLAVYRDLGVAGLPLTSVGEATVVSTSNDVALARITRVRDGVRSGDYVAPRK